MHSSRKPSSFPLPTYEVPIGVVGGEEEKEEADRVKRNGLTKSLKVTRRTFSETLARNREIWMELVRGTATKPPYEHILSVE